MPETEYHERRQHRRVPFIKEVAVPGVGILRCSDLSVGGIFLETVHSYSVGTVLTLQFKLRETDEHTISVQARVVYEHAGMGVGLCFTTLKPEDRQKIDGFIAQS